MFLRHLFRASVLALALGCGDRERETAVTVLPQETPELGRPPTAAPEVAEAPSVPRADAAPSAAPERVGGPEGVRPLEDLLRLPTAPPPDRAEARLRVGEEASPDPSDPGAGGRVKLYGESWEDRASGDPRRTRTRTDAGITFEVDRATKVRSGVRVDQDQDGQREEPVPTLGIERRF